MTAGGNVLRIGPLGIALAGLDRLAAPLAGRIRRRYGAHLSWGADAQVELAALPELRGSGSPYEAETRVEGDVLSMESPGLSVRFDLARAEGEIAVLPGRTGAEHLVENALRQIAQLLLVRRGAALIHAAGVIAPDGARALAFPGRSGAGKSTIAGLLAAAGGAVLSDDLVLLETAGERPRLVATPFFGTLVPAAPAVPREAPRAAPLAAIHLLEQAPAAGIEPIADAPTAVALLFANVPFTGGAGAEERERLIELLLGAVRRVPVSTLRFRKDLSMLPLLDWRRERTGRPAAPVAREEALR